jgi:surface polysaccharide O-acyltransferase-like enzyme
VDNSSVQPVRGRDEVFDLAKGVGILAVVTLHVTGRTAGFIHHKFDNDWWALTWVNRFVNFCVPLFLLVSAILLARGLARQEKPDWGRYASRRARAVLYPLLIWTLIYWAYHALFDPGERQPGYWLDIRARAFDLFFGKAHFHLYFLSILLQVCVLLPFLVLLFKRLRLSIWSVTLIAILTQVGFALLQKQVVFPFPGSTAFWYASTLLPGIWVGMNWRDWNSVRRVAWPLWAGCAALGFGIFAYETWHTLLASKLELAADHYYGDFLNGSTWLYVLGANFLILAGLSLRTAGGEPIKKVLLRLGEMSLQIYLMHPVLMDFLSRGWRGAIFKHLPLASLWFLIMTVAGSYAVGWLLDRIPYAPTILFGRDRPAPKDMRPSQEPQEVPVQP